jgi:hypothetical protein
LAGTPSIRRMRKVLASTQIWPSKRYFSFRLGKIPKTYSSPCCVFVATTRFPRPGLRERFFRPTSCRSPEESCRSSRREERNRFAPGPRTWVACYSRGTLYILASPHMVEIERDPGAGCPPCVAGSGSGRVFQQWMKSPVTMRRALPRERDLTARALA